MSCAPVQPVSVAHMVFGPDRLKLEVRLAQDAPRYTDAELMAHILAVRPTLPAHACVNDTGPLFSAVMDHTSIPHLLEHLIIDEQVRDSRTDPLRTFVGTTEWTSKEQDSAIIQVSYADDMVVARSVQDACKLLNACIVRDTMD